MSGAKDRETYSAARLHRFALWLIYHVPCGASWRFSRCAIVRRLGDWWLPRWYGLGVDLEDRVAPPPARIGEHTLGARRGR